RARLVVEHATGHEVGDRVFGLVPDPRGDVEVLVVMAEERPDSFRFGAFAEQSRLDRGFGESRAEVALDPVDRRVIVRMTALQRVVVRLLAQVLERTVLDMTVLASVDLDHPRVVPLTIDVFTGGLAFEDRRRTVVAGDDERIVEQRPRVHPRSHG